MTICYITIDTEYEFSFTRRMGPSSRADNFARSIACSTSRGEVGIGYQMDLFDQYGLKAVFFVDPMPALLWGTAAIEDIVGPIVERGHDVQLHMHTEWLELAAANPLGRGISGGNIKDFTYEQQCTILDYGKRVLTAAGAPSVTAFRAGNYGANDDTLYALATLGLRYDTSHCPGIAHSSCAISLTSSDRAPVEHCGVLEVPIACIAAAPVGTGLRHAQLTALSCSEMIAAIRHCELQGVGYFTLVTHSFELMSRDRSRINRVVRRRFETFCAELAGLAGIKTGTYANDAPKAGGASHSVPVLSFHPGRVVLRIAEQALSNFLYGAG